MFWTKFIYTFVDIFSIILQFELKFHDDHPFDL